MKKNLLLQIIFCLFSNLLTSQTLTVLDKTTLLKLENVEIFSLNPSAHTITNVKGQADISEFKNADTITFQRIGYQMEYFSYTQIEAANFSVLLTEKIYSFDAVVISASRFEEKKSEVRWDWLSLTVGDSARAATRPLRQRNGWRVLPIPDRVSCPRHSELVQQRA